MGTNLGVGRMPGPTARQVGYATVIVGFAEMAGLRDAIDFPDSAELTPLEVNPIRPHGSRENMWVNLELKIINVHDKRFAELTVASKFASDNMHALRSLIVDAFRSMGYETIQITSFRVVQNQSLFSVRFECAR